MVILLSSPFLPRLLAGAPSGSQNNLEGWELIWSDEFDAPDGTRINPAKWTAELGGDGWGNQEKQLYTQRPENATIEKGALVIRALKESLAGSRCWYGPCEYTSARLNTQAKFEQKYGRFEAKIQVPGGRGTWPAFWMLGSNVVEHSWPDCGEIDIMENIGKEPSTVHGTVHGPGYSGARGIGAAHSLDHQARMADAYHVFAIEWNPESIRWFVDDQMYHTVSASALPKGKPWVFDQPFFLLLNLAIGGVWPGDPDRNVVFPQVMRVDYVRVYRPRQTKS